MFIDKPLFPEAPPTRALRRSDLPNGIMATSTIRLVDLATLLPAVSIIKEDTAGPPVCRYTLDDGWTTYLDVNEIIQWGIRRGYQFVDKHAIDPRWAEYLRLHRQITAAKSRMEALEAELPIAGQRMASTTICIPHVPMIDPDVSTVAPGQRPSPRDLSAESLEKQLTKTRKDLLKERAARKKDAMLIEALKSCMTPIALEKLAKSGISRRHKPKDDGKLRPICFPVDDGELVAVRSLGDFDSVIPKERLFEKAIPVKVRSTSGIYFLLDDNDEIVYVGQAINLVKRIGEHCDQKRGLFSRVIAVAVPKHRLFELETKYIRAYDPILNNPRRKAHDPKLAAITRKRARLVQSALAASDSSAT